MKVSKRLLSLFFSFIMLLSGIPVVAFAVEEFTVDNYTYTVSGDNATIVSCSEKVTGIVNIPSTLGGKTVTAIGDGAFQACTVVTGITIPSTVKMIGKNAFAFCFSLTKIEIPSSVTSIGDNAFSRCAKLSDVYYSGSKEEWGKIEFGSNDDLLEIATIHYNSSGLGNTDLDDNPTKKTITGTLKDYTITTMVVINGEEYYDYVSDITVDGAKYSVKDKDLIPESLAKRLLNERVVIEVENGVVTDFIKYEDSDYDYKPQIRCKDTFVESYKNAFLDDNWNTFKIEGEIINYNEYHNLENVWITLKSPDANIVKFDSKEKSEVTFPLGRSINSRNSDTFKCKAYVKRDYMPAGGSETLEFECILNGLIDGKTVEGVYSTFAVKVVNLSYKEKKNKPNKTFIELLEEMKALVPLYESYYRQNKGYLVAGTGLTYEILAVETAVKTAAMDDGIDLAETAYDLSVYLSGIKNPTAAECGKMFFEQLSANSESELDKVIEITKQRLIDNEFFDDFIEWCCKEHDVDVGEYAKFSDHCPTDIIITDEFDGVVLKIINNEIVLCANNISVDVFESRKTIYLPTDLDYEIKIIATGDGTMDYFVETITEYGERRLIKYNDVPLINGESYTTIAPTDKSSETAVFNLVSENGNVVSADKEEIAHTFGEYDTKCTYCGFDRTKNCSCACHKTGISAFFYKIARFFWKLFRIHQTCACGAAHY